MGREADGVSSPERGWIVGKSLRWWEGVEIVQANCHRRSLGQNIRHAADRRITHPCPFEGWTCVTTWGWVLQQRWGVSAEGVECGRTIREVEGDGE